MQAAQNLSSMTEAQLRNFLFGDHFNQMSFIQATSEYMQVMSETEAHSMRDASESMNTETKAQEAITSITKKLSDEYIQELQEQQEMQPSSMPSWLGDIVAAFSVLASIATLNPVLIGMSTIAFTLQVSGLQQKMMQAACGNDPSKQAAFSFGFAMGEAIIGGGISCAGDAAALAQATAKGAQVTAQTAGQVALNFVKYTTTYLGQALMSDNFWPEFFQGPCKMSQEGAIIAGMLVGIGVGMASTVVASSNEDGLTQMTRNWFSKLSDKSQTMFRMLTTALHLMGDGFQIGSGAQMINISNEFKKLSDFERDVMAPTMSKFSLAQGISSGMNSMINQTQNLLQTLGDDSTAINQTFSSFADMLKPAQQ